MRHILMPGVKKPVSTVCLGTGSFGSAYSEELSFSLLDAFAAEVGTFLDTAHVYADWLPNGSGASERTVGAWVRSRGVQDRFVIGTKGAHPRLDAMQISRLSPKDIAQDLSESLDRLGLPTVDLYWVHRDDPEIPVGEILGALNDHLRAGTIGAIGASNWSASRLEEAADYAAKHQLTPFCASQIAWSLAQDSVTFDPVSGTRSMDTVDLEYYCESGLPVIPYTSQAGGFFAHPYDDTRSRFRRYHSPLNKLRWDRTKEIAAKRHCSSNAVAVAYLLMHPCGGFAIVGSHTLDQIADSCLGADIWLDDDDLKYLEGA